MEPFLQPIATQESDLLEIKQLMSFFKLKDFRDLCLNNIRFNLLKNLSNLKKFTDDKINNIGWSCIIFQLCLNGQTDKVSFQSIYPIVIPNNEKREKEYGVAQRKS